MELTAFSLKPIRQTLLDDAPCVTRSQIDDDPLPAVFHPRRFSDPVSPLNDMVYDRARLLAGVVEMIDGLGIEIMNVDADRVRNSRVQVAPSRQCDALEGVEFKRANGWSHWVANRFGVEIVWRIPVQEAA